MDDFAGPMRLALCTCLVAVSLASIRLAVAATSDVREVATEVLHAFEARDGERLASYAHPEKGVRFSPSAFVAVSEDVVLTRDQIARFWDDENVYGWGYADGSGEPLEMTPAAYADRYVLDHDFQGATVKIDQFQSYGNTVNNVHDTYPAATTVEYYIPPSATDSEAGIDWAALRLVFENAGGRWSLVGVIHDEWSV